MAGDSGSLAARLLKLAKYVRECVREGRESGKIIEVAGPYVKASVTNFSYGDQGAINIATSYEYVQKSEWHWRHQYTFAEEIHASPAFKECVPAVAAEFATQDADAEFRLSQFVQVLVSKAADTQSDEDLLDVLTTFIADLHGAPMIMDVSAWVDGLWLGCPCLTASGIEFRRPEQKDFEYERSFDLQLFTRSEPWPLGMPPAFALFQVRGAGTQEAQNAVET